mmetsp:Transcript_67004/g.157212  ORF Transcript_67004/g.157212 Transcript_67004/m.157212 type:complete len:97 (+) Transcript_67004:1752-2042(+)
MGRGCMFFFHLEWHSFKQSSTVTVVSAGPLKYRISATGLLRIRTFTSHSENTPTLRSDGRSMVNSKTPKGATCARKDSSCWGFDGLSTPRQESFTL